MAYETHEQDFIEAIKYNFPDHGTTPSQETLSEYASELAVDFGIEPSRAVRIAECEVVFEMVI